MTSEEGGNFNLAESIPEEGWKRLIDTACNTFSDLVAPFTKTTAGLGALIQAKFEGMADVQKVYVADTLQKAKAKVEKRGSAGHKRPKARVLIQSIEQASVETDDDFREVWANLLANEMISGDVHPEFPEVLSRLSPDDASGLAYVAEKEPDTVSRALILALNRAINSFVTIHVEPGSFEKENLERLGLIRRSDGYWRLTHFGRAFIKVVSDPNDCSDEQ